MKQFSIDFLNKIPTPVLHDLKSTINEVINERRVRYELSQKFNKPIKLNESYFHGSKYRRTNSESAYFDILDDDWNYLFTGQYCEEPKFYVYIHYDIRTKNIRLTSKERSIGIDFPFRPFYIGKGTKDRFLSKNRSNQHKALINKMEAFDPNNRSWAQIFKNNLTEKEALILEAKLILFFGCKGLTKGPKHFTGLKSGLLVNNEYPAVPEMFLNDIVRV